jgi:hypothetical protein
MSDDPASRGGTEPLAALVSVAAICIAISVYAGFASEVVRDSEDGEPDGATLDSVWVAVNENGILDASESLDEQLGPETLPRGHSVAVNVTVVGDDGRLETVGNATFDANASAVSMEPPPGATVRDRPVPVRIDDGEIRPGRLRVVVWDG